MENKENKTFEEKVIKFANESPVNFIPLFNIIKIIAISIFIIDVCCVICIICSLFN